MNHYLRGICGVWSNKINLSAYLRHFTSNIVLFHENIILFMVSCNTIINLPTENKEGGRTIPFSVFNCNGGEQKFPV